MTIRKGEEWGELRVPVSEILTVRSDAELCDLVESGESGPIGLLGGDMMRTLGGAGDADRFDRDQPIPHLPIDIVRVTIDEREQKLFVAHLVALRSWWRGPITAVMNAEFRGDWDVAPRAHPNDGKVDIVTVAAELGLQQRMMARSRIRTGTHVPHPRISIVQRAEATVQFDKPTSITLDGRHHGSASRLDVTVVPDAVVVCV